MTGKFEHHQTQSQIRITRTKLERNRTAQAVADDYRLLQSKLAALPGNVIGKPRWGVFLLRRVTCAVTAKVNGDDPPFLGKVGDLGREDAVVAGPAVDKE